MGCPHPRHPLKIPTPEEPVVGIASVTVLQAAGKFKTEDLSRAKSPLRMKNKELIGTTEIVP